MTLRCAYEKEKKLNGITFPPVTLKDCAIIAGRIFV
jgi:hypothetical protein